MQNKQRINNWINNILLSLSHLDNDNGIDILHQCGKDCCEKSYLFQGAVKIRNQYKTEKDDDKLFEEFKYHFYNSEKLTKRGKSITLIFENCTCPIVQNGMNNSFLCNCTIGYSKRVFEVLFSKEVTIDLEKSILRGDNVCKQNIEILD